MTTPSADRPLVGLCAGKDCRREVGFSKLRTALERDCSVVDFKCLGLCNGPVAVAYPDSATPIVYSKLRTKQHRLQLVGVLLGSAVAGPSLARRRVVKRKALVAAERQMRRRITLIRRAA